MNKNILSNHPKNSININNNNFNPMNNSLNNNINYNKNLNPNLNNQKSEIILNSLILLYANSKEMNRIFSPNIHENYNLKKYVLINKAWLDDIKNYFNYNEINNLLSQEKYKFNIYDDYKNNLSYLNTLPEFKNIRAKLAIISLTKINQNKPGNNKNIHPKLNIPIPLPFELINESLFNLIKQYIPNINEHQLKYKVIFGYSTLYFLSQNESNIIYVYAYIYDNINKKFSLFAICILKDSTIIKGIFDKYLNKMAFKDYLIIKNLKLNLLNQKQNIIGSNGSKQADVILTYQIDQIGQVNQINQANQFDQINQFNQNNPVFQNNQIINENNEMNQNNKPTDLNQKNENIGNLQNEKNIFNANYSIYKNFKNFLQELKNLKDENIENLMFNGIETDLNYKILQQIFQFI